jgi:hypothetical protein
MCAPTEPPAATLLLFLSRGFLGLQFPMRSSLRFFSNLCHRTPRSHFGFSSGILGSGQGSGGEIPGVNGSISFRPGVGKFGCGSGDGGLGEGFGPGEEGVGLSNGFFG